MYLAGERSTRPATEIALLEFEHLYSYIHSRVGNRADAEDLTQQVALRALPRLRNGYAGPAVRSYLYTTARSVMASFWCHRALVPEAELADDVWIEGRGDELVAPAPAAEWRSVPLHLGLGRCGLPRESEPRLRTSAARLFALSNHVAGSKPLEALHSCLGARPQAVEHRRDHRLHDRRRTYE